MKYKIKANPDAEIGVLGTLITIGDPNSPIVKKCMLQLNDSFFYQPSFRELYQFIRKCYEEVQWFDISSLLGMNLSITLHDLLFRSIQGQLFTGNLLDHHLDELKKLYKLRTQIAILEQTLRECNNEPMPNLCAEIIRIGLNNTSNITMDKAKEGFTFQDIYQEYLNGEFKNDTQVQCGIKQFGEIRNCGLITLAADSGVGKTFFSIHLMNEIIKYQTNKQFLFFSLEMKRSDIWDRYLSIKLNKPISQVTNEERATKLPDGKVYDQPRIDIDYIETISHLQSMEKPVSVIVVDYLTLVSTKKRHDRDDLKISDITQRLAALAMNLNCIVIGLSQVNREASKRTKDDRCPYPSDVADSVGSVRSASLWIGLDRPETYNESTDSKNLFIAKCRKSRYGSNFEAYFDFNEGRFKERDKPFWTPQSTKQTGRDKFISAASKLNNHIGDM